MKKLVSILMMFALLLSFTACGNSGTGEESENLTDSASQTEQKPLPLKKKPTVQVRTHRKKSNLTNRKQKHWLFTFPVPAIQKQLLKGFPS